MIFVCFGGGSSPARATTSERVIASRPQADAAIPSGDRAATTTTSRTSDDADFPASTAPARRCGPFVEFPAARTTARTPDAERDDAAPYGELPGSTTITTASTTAGTAARSGYAAWDGHTDANVDARSGGHGGGNGDGSSWDGRASAASGVGSGSGAGRDGDDESWDDESCSGGLRLRCLFVMADWCFSFTSGERSAVPPVDA